MKDQQSNRDAEIARLEDLVASQETEIAQMKSRLEEIYGSNAWKIIVFLWELRLKLAPNGSRREKLLRAFLRTIRAIPDALKQSISRMFHPRMSWYAYAFDRYKRARHAYITPRLDKVRCPTQPGLVSIILPVYNGAEYLGEALDGILQQTYQQFELIVIDDGSTDETPQILSSYEGGDPRLRLLRQENQRLPRALSNGFRLARGEFLTWTSADNRLKPDFLAKMVDCLQRHPDWDMVYANQDIIGEDGELLIQSSWYEGYQDPSGSGQVILPSDPSELNVWANNYVGGAFMYRDRVHYLLGDYSQRRFGTEDYDYWMRINGLLRLHHADFRETIYEYRFHSDSLTSRDEELGITRYRDRLMVFEDFRRDFNLSPLVWIIESSNDPQAEDLANNIRQWIREANHVVLDDLSYVKDLPELWCPVVCLKVVTAESASLPPIPGGLDDSWKAVVVCNEGKLPEEMHPDWDVCITTAGDTSLPRLSAPRQGWLSISDLNSLCTTLDIQARSVHTARIEAEIENPKQSSYKISVVVCTYHRGDLLIKTLDSLTKQTIPTHEYEVIVVNNDPDDHWVSKILSELRLLDYRECPDRLKLVICPLKGLSFARNAGISEAQGEIICFIDDDATAEPNWLEQILVAYKSSPNTGVVGGHILLQTPDPRPKWVKPGWEKFWSHFVPGYTGIKKANIWWELPWGANWSARRQALMEIGGFRTRYGRKGSDFGGGEEIIAGLLIWRMGYDILINPDAVVLHFVDPSRFTFKHVWRTIQAGKRTEYRQQIDLYIPMQISYLALIRDILTNMIKCISPKSLKIYQRVEHFAYVWVVFKLSMRFIYDHLARLRTSFTMKY